MGFTGGSVVKKSTCSAGATGDLVSIPCVRKIPWRRAWQPTPNILAWEIPWIEESGGPQSMLTKSVQLRPTLQPYGL